MAANPNTQIDENRNLGPTVTTVLSIRNLKSTNHGEILDFTEKLRAAGQLHKPYKDSGLISQKILEALNLLVESQIRMGKIDPATLFKEGRAREDWTHEEIFNLIKCLRPDIFKSLTSFSIRYCDQKQCNKNINLANYGIDRSGSSNPKELNYILSHVN